MGPSSHHSGGATASPSQDDEPKATIACLVCRSRKVKCDKTMPECRNCLRLGVQCPGFNPQSEFISRKDMQKSADDIFRAAGVEKRRVGSCEECRASKHRCTKTRPSCRRCFLRSLPCVYPSKSDKQQERELSAQATSSVTSSTAPTITPIDSGQSHEDMQWPNASLFHVFGINIESLCTDTLPVDQDLRLRLINAYFDRTHQLRNLSFIHRPSFMQSFDRSSVGQDYGEPLLYVMCALGARHIYFDAIVGSDGSDIESLHNTVPGQLWAERAMKEVLVELHSPTVPNLMTMTLLTEYELREDQNALVFTLVAFLYRAIRLLSLDCPGPLQNPLAPDQLTQRESENRLVWASYFIDNLIANGIEKNMCWNSHTPEIPLPCADEAFLSQTPCATYYLHQVEGSGMLSMVSQLDISALYVLIMRLRTRVMRLIRVADPDMRIWEPMSEFLQIIEQLRIIFHNLPQKYHLSEANMYSLKETGMLGAAFSLNLLVHAVIFDLTRISLPGFNFPLAPVFKNSPPEFRSHCQNLSRYHASQASDIIQRGMAFDYRAFDDLFCADAAVESAKIQIIYSATVDQSPQNLQTTRENIITSLSFLLTLNTRGKDAPTYYIRTILPLCHLFGFRDIAERYQETLGIPIDPAEVTGSADIHHLSTVASFRRGRSQVQESRSASSSNAMSSTNSNKSPLIQASGNLFPGAATSPIEVDHTNSLPMLRPPYSQPAPAPDVLSQNLPQRNALQIMPSAGAMVQNGAILQPSVDDYIKTADEMSSYLTWGMPEMPHWMQMGDGMSS